MNITGKSILNKHPHPLLKLKIRIRIRNRGCAKSDIRPISTIGTSKIFSVIWQLTNEQSQ